MKTTKRGNGAVWPSKERNPNQKPQIKEPGVSDQTRVVYSEETNSRDG